MDALIFSPFSALHSKLQSGKVGKATLEENFDWLLHGTQRFRPSNEASRKQISENTRLQFKGKAFVFDAKHRPLALRLAKLLVRPSRRVGAIPHSVQKSGPGPARVPALTQARMELI